MDIERGDVLRLQYAYNSRDCAWRAGEVDEDRATDRSGIYMSAEALSGS